MTLSTKQLRKSILQERRALTPQKIKNLSRFIHEQIISSSFFLTSHRIAFYLPYSGEVETASLLKKAFQMQKQCFLPVLHPIKHNRLWFVEYFPGDKLKRNLYGILEPDITKRKMVPPWSLDLIFLPLVAFDEQGHRIGMGGGYYDRTFAFKTKSKRRHFPMLVGLAYEFQKHLNLPTGEWDVNLERVVTEKTIYFFPYR